MTALKTLAAFRRALAGATIQFVSDNSFDADGTPRDNSWAITRGTRRYGHDYIVTKVTNSTVFLRSSTSYGTKATDVFAFGYASDWTFIGDDTAVHKTVYGTGSWSELTIKIIKEAK